MPKKMQKKMDDATEEKEEKKVMLIEEEDVTPIVPYMLIEEGSEIPMAMHEGKEVRATKYASIARHKAKTEKAFTLPGKLIINFFEGMGDNLKPVIDGRSYFLPKYSKMSEIYEEHLDFYEKMDEYHAEAEMKQLKREMFARRLANMTKKEIEEKGTTVKWPSDHLQAEWKTFVQDNFTEVNNLMVKGAANGTPPWDLVFQGLNQGCDQGEKIRQHESWTNFHNGKTETVKPYRVFANAKKNLDKDSSLAIINSNLVPIICCTRKNIIKKHQKENEKILGREVVENLEDEKCLTEINRVAILARSLVTELRTLSTSFVAEFNVQHDSDNELSPDSKALRDKDWQAYTDQSRTLAEYVREMQALYDAYMKRQFDGANFSDKEVAEMETEIGHESAIHTLMEKLVTAFRNFKTHREDTEMLARTIKSNQNRRELIELKISNFVDDFGVQYVHNDYGSDSDIIAPIRLSAEELMAKTEGLENFTEMYELAKFIAETMQKDNNEESVRDCIGRLGKIQDVSLHENVEFTKIALTLGEIFGPVEDAIQKMQEIPMHPLLHLAMADHNVKFKDKFQINFRDNIYKAYVKSDPDNKEEKDEEHLSTDEIANCRNIVDDLIDCAVKVSRYAFTFNRDQENLYSLERKFKMTALFQQAERVKKLGADAQALLKEDEEGRIEKKCNHEMIGRTSRVIEAGATLNRLIDNVDKVIHEKVFEKIKHKKMISGPKVKEELQNAGYVFNPAYTEVMQELIRDYTNKPTYIKPTTEMQILLSALGVEEQYFKIDKFSKAIHALAYSQNPLWDKIKPVLVGMIRLDYKKATALFSSIAVLLNSVLIKYKTGLTPSEIRNFVPAQEIISKLFTDNPNNGGKMQNLYVKLAKILLANNLHSI